MAGFNTAFAVLSGTDTERKLRVRLNVDDALTCARELLVEHTETVTIAPVLVPDDAWGYSETKAFIAHMFNQEVTE